MTIQLYSNGEALIESVLNRPFQELFAALVLDVNDPPNGLPNVGDVLGFDGTNLQWVVGGGGGGAPTTATYILQSPNGVLTNAQAINALANGILKHTAGVFATAIGGTDYANAVHTHDANAIVSGTIDIARLGLSGTPSATTFLRGDNTWAVPAGGGGAPVGASYVVMALDGTLTSERVLTGSSPNILVSDGGAGGLVTINVGSNIPLKDASNIWGPGTTQTWTTGGPTAFAHRYQTSGDPSYRYEMRYDGLMYWGSGAATPTVTLGFNGTNGLSLTGALAVSGVLSGLIDAASLTSGTVPLARLGSGGTPSATTFLRGDNTWAIPAGNVGDAVLAASNTWGPTTTQTYTTVTATVARARSRLTTDTAYRYTIDFNGTIQWGPGGVASTDVTLGRTSVGVLTVGGTLAATKVLAQTSADGVVVFQAKVQAEGSAALEIDTDGKIGWSSGSAATDVFLERTGVGALTITGALAVTGALSGQINAASLTAGTVPLARLGASGTPSTSTFLRGDNTWATPAGGGGGDALLGATQIWGPNTLNSYTGTTAGNAWIVSRLSSDTQPRLSIALNGAISWGQGGVTATDVTLSRSSISTLTLSGSGIVTGNWNVQSALNVIGAAGNAIYIAVTGDTQPRLLVNHDGQHSWGSGAAVGDVTLARSAVGTLTVTGALAVTGVLSGQINSASIVSGTIGTARLGSGTANATTFLRGDQTWVAVSGGGDAVLANSQSWGPDTVQTYMGTIPTSYFIRGMVTGDTNPLFAIRRTGELNWGAGGTNAVDTQLARTSTTTLTLTGSLAITATLAVTGALTGQIPASSIVSGTIATARLGSGTASATTFLSGDQTWKAVTIDAAAIVSGTVALARLGLSGTPSTTTFLRGDNTWATPVGSAGDAVLGANNTWGPTTTQTYTSITATTSRARSRLTTDTNYRYSIDFNGAIQWGPGGTSSTDVTLSRTGTGRLTLGGTFAADKLVGQAGADGVIVFQAMVSAESFAALDIDSDGKMRWTSGAAPFDVSLARSGAGILDVAGQLTVNGYNVLKRSKSISIISPTAGDKIVMFYADLGGVIAQVVSVLAGAGTSVLFSVHYGPDISLAGTELVTGGITCSSKTTGLITSSFTNPSIPANNFVWITITTVTGEIDELHVTLTN